MLAALEMGTAKFEPKMALRHQRSDQLSASKLLHETLRVVPDCYHSKCNPAALASLFLSDDRGQRLLGFVLFLPGIKHLQAQAIIRCLLAQLRPDSGEELSPVKGNAQDIIRPQIQSMAALQRPAVSEKDDLDWRRGLIALELCQQATAVERAHIRLQQDQIRLLLQNCPHIRAFRRSNIVPGARKFRYEAAAQILSDTQQEDLWHAPFSLQG